jgi:uncharacterized membrane protein
MTKKNKPEFNSADYEKIGRMMEDIVASNHANKMRFFWFTFFKGIIYGLGIFIGGTIVVAFVIWLLTQFNDAPIIGPFLDKLLYVLNNGSPAPKP